MRDLSGDELAAIELEQVRLIEAYLSELWCPARPMFGPERPQWIEKPRADNQWVRNLDLPALMNSPYPEILNAIRAA